MTISANLHHDPLAPVQKELDQFNGLADVWWDASGPMWPLHKLNHLRAPFVQQSIQTHFGAGSLEGITILDIGCGGGLIAEPLARLGAEVTAIDAGEDAIEAARLHCEKSELTIAYRQISAEQLALEEERFDCVLTLEVVEHVADLPSFLEASAELIRPGGTFFAATLNRTAASYLLGIVAAERILRWLPPGIHQWSKFVRPSELVAPLRRHGVAIQELSGISYDPLSRSWSLSKKLDVNYIAFGIKS